MSNDNNNEMGGGPVTEYASHKYVSYLKRALNLAAWSAVALIFVAAVMNGVMPDQNYFVKKDPVVEKLGNNTIRWDFCKAQGYRLGYASFLGGELHVYCFKTVDGKHITESFPLHQFAEYLAENGHLERSDFE